MRAPSQLAAALLAAVVARCLAWRAIDDVALEPSLLQGETERADSFFMIELADPQLGMQHYGKMSWKEELEMLNLAVEQINRLKPAFVVLVGDMQNWYQTDRKDGRKENGDELAGTQAGRLQVEDVHESLKGLKGVIVLATLPGNHDVGDEPTSESLEWYEEQWGPQFGSFDHQFVHFASVNSQLYFAKPTSEEVKRKMQNQTRWLREDLATAGAKEHILGVVVLSHIPPFVGSDDEQHGWGNWDLESREQVLRITQGATLPASVFVCGHFHGNVEGVYSYSRFGAKVEVVTSSAVGCPMHWNGESGPYDHRLASAIAAQPTGGEAFLNYIAKNDKGDFDLELKQQRIQATKHRSGVRVFEFNRVSGYRHRWFTLDALSHLDALDDKTLQDTGFTPFHNKSAS